MGGAKKGPGDHRHQGHGQVLQEVVGREGNLKPWPKIFVHSWFGNYSVDHKRPLVITVFI